MIQLYNVDCRKAMAGMAENSVDSVVTDPPYGLKFMGKAWDHGVPGVEFWTAAMRVMKPGAYMLAFGGTRTFHRLVCAIEDAGFEIRDTIMWVYGSGFAKSWNVKRAEMCQCGNALQSTHDESEAEYHLRSLFDGDLQAPEPHDEERELVLQPRVPVQSQTESGSGAEGSKPETCRQEQPGMERGVVHRTGEGLRDDSDAVASEGTAERICVGTHLGGGKDARSPADGDRRSTPQRLESSEQSSEESGYLCDPLGTLDDRALQNGGGCSRCGKLRKEYEGWGTALKPAFEPIILVRKPLIGTVAANVLAHGTGGLNIDGCRVGDEPITQHGRGDSENRSMSGRNYAEPSGREWTGRWPANLIHDGSDEVLAAFPQAPGQQADVSTTAPSEKTSNVYGKMRREGEASANSDNEGAVGFKMKPGARRLDEESAARFFYCAKSSRKDRGEGNGHPTVKPTDLMRYLCRLVTPPGGVVLDPFMGSGSTGKAAMLEGFDFIGCDNDPESFATAESRISAAELERLFS